MMGINNRIRVIPSDELADMRLSGMTGRCGMITEHVSGASGGLIGYMVLLEKSFQGERLWFVPKNAVEHENNSE